MTKDLEVALKDLGETERLTALALAEYCAHPAAGKPNGFADSLFDALTEAREVRAIARLRVDDAAREMGRRSKKGK